MSSPMNPVSTQSSAVANRSTMPGQPGHDLGKFLDHPCARSPRDAGYTDAPMNEDPAIYTGRPAFVSER
jgi:hypothetical protein